MEIERKYLPHNLPFKLEDYDNVVLEQAYISTSPVIRVRQKSLTKAGHNTPESNKYILTVKSTGMMERQEFELELDEASYKQLLKKAEGNIITKKRYFIPLEDSLKLELDVFEGIFDGLVMGEIEFPSRESAEKYTPPAYLAEEVTYDKRFHNSNMSTMSKEEISDLITWIHGHNS